eukprot:14040369-Ditylum_brightwellii.AAC.1
MLRFFPSVSPPTVVCHFETSAGSWEPLLSSERDMRSRFSTNKSEEECGCAYVGIPTRDLQFLDP